jgi:ABC-type transport system involved in multi-copper enzyme maturation permease subunit
MIATIKAEWRKNRFRPAFLVTSGLLAALTVFAYGTNWYLALHPNVSQRDGGVNILSLYPDQFVNNVMGAGFPIGAAMAIVLGALFAGSEYSWGTLKTLLTQRSGRLTTWIGRVVVFEIWMAILTLVLFAMGAASSVVVASFQGHAIAWPALIDLGKGMAAILLIFSLNGALGMALGTLFKNSAAALGVGLVYLLALQIIVVRFIDSVNNGAYKWIGDLFDGQNTNALLHTFTSAAFGPSAPLSIGPERAVTVLFIYLAAFLVVAAGLLRQRDVT